MKNGRLYRSTVVIDPKTGKRFTALTRNKRFFEKQIRKAGWTLENGIWHAPEGVTPEHIPQEFPLGIPIKSFTAVCIHHDYMRDIYTHKIGIARRALRHCGWKRVKRQWRCPYH